MNNKMFWIVGVVVVVMVGVVTYQMSSNSADKSGAVKDSVQNYDSSPTAPMEKPTGQAVAPKTGKTFTLDEVGKHAVAEDCWMAINGKIYDATSYIQKQIHPGGAAILFGCGKDSTAIFNLRPKDNKPHSAKANSMLDTLYIGELAK